MQVMLCGRALRTRPTMGCTLARSQQLMNALPAKTRVGAKRTLRSYGHA